MQAARMVAFLLLCSTFFNLAQAQFNNSGFAPQVYRSTLSSNFIAYYGKEFYTELNTDTRNQQIKVRLRTIMTSYHIKTQNDYDQIQSQPCNGQSGCYRHKSIGYDNAKIFLMGYFYLVQTSGGYGVREVYCSRVYNHTEFNHEPPFPKKVPSANVVNTEHTWPQSRFNRRQSIEEQKSDLHHLFPTDSKLNSIRGNLEFGQVVQPTENLHCSSSKIGISNLNKARVFEPPNQHKGNVARALFYFSTRYDLPISLAEETTLRAWNRLDPVDQEEMQRNEAIYQLEGTRNPFIDYPELADRIAHF